MWTAIEGLPVVWHSVQQNALTPYAEETIDLVSRVGEAGDAAVSEEDKTAASTCKVRFVHFFLFAFFLFSFVDFVAAVSLKVCVKSSQRVFW